MSNKNYQRQYSVSVKYICAFTKNVEVWAENEEEAKQKAEEVVLNWNNVVEAEAEEPEEL